MRRLPLGVGDRHPVREVARPGQREDVPPVGVDDRVEAGHQPRHGHEAEQVGRGVAAQRGPEAVQQRLGRLADAEGPGRHARVQDQGEHPEDDQA